MLGVYAITRCSVIIQRSTALSSFKDVYALSFSPSTMLDSVFTCSDIENLFFYHSQIFIFEQNIPVYEHFS